MTWNRRSLGRSCFSSGLRALGPMCTSSDRTGTLSGTSVAGKAGVFGLSCSPLATARVSSWACTNLVFSRAVTPGLPSALCPQGCFPSAPLDRTEMRLPARDSAPKRRESRGCRDQRPTGRGCERRPVPAEGPPRLVALKNVFPKFRGKEPYGEPASFVAVPLSAETWKETFFTGFHLYGQTLGSPANTKQDVFPDFPRNAFSLFERCYK